MDEETIFICPYCHEENTRLNFSEKITGTRWGTAYFNREGDINDSETEDEETDGGNDFELECQDCSHVITDEELKNNITTRDNGEVVRKKQKANIPQEPEMTDIEAEEERRMPPNWRIKRQELKGAYSQTNAVECPYCEEMFLSDEEDFKTCTNCSKTFTIENIINKHNANNN